jgi:hypothetical protein
MPMVDPMIAKLQIILKAIGLLRQDKLRGFRIEIDTDSTIQSDAQEEKAARIEFIEGVTKFIETAAQVTAGVPEFATLAAKMLQFGVRGFRVGRDLESAIEEFCDKAEQKAKTQGPSPNPEQIKAESEKARSAAKIQQIQMQGALDLKQQQQQAAIDAERSKTEQQKLQYEIRMKEMDQQLKAMDIEIAKIRAQADLAKIGHEQRQRDRESMETEKTGKDMAPMKDALGAVVQHLGEHAKHLKALYEHSSAPIEFIHNKAGKVMGARRVAQ